MSENENELSQFLPFSIYQYGTACYERSLLALEFSCKWIHSLEEPWLPNYLYRSKQFFINLLIRFIFTIWQLRLESKMVKAMTQIERQGCQYIFDSWLNINLRYWLRTCCQSCDIVVLVTIELHYCRVTWKQQKMSVLPATFFISELINYQYLLII